MVRFEKKINITVNHKQYPVCVGMNSEADKRNKEILEQRNIL